MIICPKCRLISPPEAETCDCGYNFITEIQDKEDEYNPTKYKNENSKILIGIIINVAIGFISVIVYFFVHIFVYGLTGGPFPSIPEYSFKNISMFSAIMLFYYLVVILINYLVYKNIHHKNKSIYLMGSLFLVVVSIIFSVVNEFLNFKI